MNGNKPASPSCIPFLILLVGFLAFLAFIIFLYVTPANAQWEHDDPPVTYRAPTPLDWIAKYRGRRMGCCGHQDCVKVRMRVMNFRPSEAYGQIADVEFFLPEDPETARYIYDFPMRAVFASEDENDYFCFIPKNFGSDHGHVDENPINDPCVQDPKLECSNCFFWAPKG